MIWGAVALAGGLGAWGRYRLDTWVRERTQTAIPTGTLTINIAGSLALGVLLGWSLHHPAEHLVAILGTGLLGGFTTFSTAMVEWVNLVEAGQRRPALLLALAMTAGGLIGASAGLLIGQALA